MGAALPIVLIPGGVVTERIPEPAPTNPPDLEVTFVTHGPVTEADREAARRVVENLSRKVPRPILFARVKLQTDEGRTPDENAIVQATVDVSGALLRSQVAAPTIYDALNAVAERLDRHVRTLAERRQDTRDRPASTPEGEWRRGDVPTARPSFMPRPPEERRIIRRKTFAPERTAVEDALFDLDVLDHRFFLFTDEDDGEDSIVFETDDGVRLRRLSGDEPSDRPGSPVPVDVETTPAPELDEDEARQLLDVSREPFIFFRSRDSRRGAVLYRRYDGHYGIVEPATG